MMSLKLLALLVVFSTANAKHLKCVPVEPPPCGIRCAQNYRLNDKKCQCECALTEKSCPAGSNFDQFNCQCISCNENEEFSCGTPQCDPTCENYKEECTIVNIRCEDYCFCKPGYVRNSAGECVTTDQCSPKQCKLHENYNDCGSACPDTCDNYDDMDRFCTEQCVKGCFCEDGYVRNAAGDCVTIDMCPPKKCEFHESYNDCGSACPDTCDNYDDMDRFCTEQCVKGCFCNAGYVRNFTGQCVTTDLCPSKECGLHESYTDCASACPDTCDNYKDEGKICTMQCRLGCVCDSGYVRNAEGKCVTIDECPPKKCGEHETFKPCGSACPDTCDNYKDSPRPCTKNCVSDCFCDEGYVRSEDGKCIKPSSCPATCIARPCEWGYLWFPDPVCNCVLACDYVMTCRRGEEWDFIECGCVKVQTTVKPGHHQQSEEHSMEKSMEKSKEKSIEKPKEKSKEKSIEKPKEKSKEKSKEKPKEKSIEKPKEKSKEKSIEKPKEKSKEESKEKPKEKSIEKPKEKSKEKSVEKPKEKSKEKPKEKSNDKGKVKN